MYKEKIKCHCCFKKSNCPCLGRRANRINLIGDEDREVTARDQVARYLKLKSVSKFPIVIKFKSTLINGRELCYGCYVKIRET